MKSILAVAYLFSVSFLMVNCNNDHKTKLTQQDELSLIDKRLNELNKGNVIYISRSENREISFSEKDGWEEGWKAASNPKMEIPGILCKGSDLGFVKCVKKNLDKGKTIRVHKEGDTYYAEEMNNIYL